MLFFEKAKEMALEAVRQKKESLEADLQSSSYKFKIDPTWMGITQCHRKARNNLKEILIFAAVDETVPSVK